jgi:deazaflavin-dependent oxidoreductase (nitroreductase family)
MLYTPETETRLRRIFITFNRFMLALWRLGLGRYGNPTDFGGAIMVIKHRGRKSGQIRYAPVNFAEIEGNIYCTAGFGTKTHWYQNLQADPNVELWLPDSRWAGIAEDASEAENRTEPVTGPGGPGDLAWVWPLATFIMLGLLLRRRRRGSKSS